MMNMPALAAPVDRRHAATFIASLLAGPIFSMTFVVMAAVPMVMADTLHDGWGAEAMMAPFAILTASLIALILVWIPSYLLTLVPAAALFAVLDRRAGNNPDWRTPGRWRMAGVVLGGGIALLINVIIGIGEWRADPRYEFSNWRQTITFHVIGTIACVVAGTVVAAVRRRMVYGAARP